MRGPFGRHPLLAYSAAISISLYKGREMANTTSFRKVNAFYLMIALCALALVVSADPLTAPRSAASEPAAPVVMERAPSDAPATGPFSLSELGPPVVD